MSRTVKFFATLFVGIIVVAALLPSLLAPGDPLAVDPSEAFQAPSLQYPFATDESGRDVYTRVIHGTSDSRTIGLAATALGMGIAILLGGVTAFGPRWSDAVILHALEMLYVILTLLMALIIIAFTGPVTTPAIIAVSLATAPVS